MKNIYTSFLFVLFFSITYPNLIVAQETYRVTSREQIDLRESRESKVISKDSKLNLTIKVTPQNISIENHKVQQRIDYPINRISEEKEEGKTIYYCDSYEVSLVKYATRLEIINFNHKIGKIYHIESIDAGGVTAGK